MQGCQLPSLMRLCKHIYGRCDLCTAMSAPCTNAKIDGLVAWNRPLHTFHRDLLHENPIYYIQHFQYPGLLNNILACLIIFWESFLLIKYMPLTKKLWSLSFYRIYNIPHQGNSLQYDFTTKVEGTKAEARVTLSTSSKIVLAVIEKPATSPFAPSHMCVGDVALPTIPHRLPAK